VALRLWPAQISRMTGDADATRLALIAGARRSREACSPPDSQTGLPRLWRRHKWTIIGVGLFLLLDLLLLGGLGSKFGTHF
jgi:hypothetical protein